MQLRAILLCAAVTAGCGDDGSTNAVTGTFSLAWTLTDTGGAPITCDQIGATTIAVTLQRTDGSSSPTASFACGGSPGTSPAIPVGHYNVSIALQGTGLDAVAAPAQNGVVIAQNQTTALAPVTFAVNATGNLALQIAPPSPLTTNCGAAPTGAAINAETITFEHTGDGCLPITFTRSKGGTYTVNCAAPNNAGCIETDETLTATNVPSGSYTIHIRGKIGATDCFTNDDALSVPAQGRSLTHTFTLAATKPGC